MLNKNKPRGKLKHGLLTNTDTKLMSDKHTLVAEPLIQKLDSELQNNDLIAPHSIQQEAIHRYSNLFEFAPVAYFVIKPDSEIVTVNNPGASLFATDKAALIGRKLTEYICPSNQQAFIEALDLTFHNNQSTRVEVKLSHHSTPLWVNIELKPDTNEGQGLAGLIDVSSLKEHEVEMALISAVYNSLTEAVIVEDKNNIIINVNPSFTKLTGYQADEVIGQSSLFLRSNEEAPLFYEKMFEILNKTGKWEGEVSSTQKNGTSYIKWLSISSIYDQNNDISHRVSIFSDISEKKNAEALILKQANFDLLTGLPNRRLFNDRLSQGINKTARNHTKLALLSLDIDKFKEVNDSLGHCYGDKLLMEAAIRLTECIRDSDTLARLGGDEFSVIMSSLADISNVRQVISRVLETMAEPFPLNESIAYVTASIGIAIFPDDATTAEELINAADNAMYTAKREGRNCSHFFTPEMQSENSRKILLGNELRHVIAKEQLMMVYQPIVNLASGKVHKAEALVRWHHDELGDIPPIEFIHIAEDNGLIFPIGEWIFQHVAKQTLAWREQYCKNFKISINKSPAQFQKNNQHCSWLNYLENIGLAGDAIIVEITENLLMDSSKFTDQLLSTLNSSGLQIALDDFGTGYSSLAYLKKFHVDYLKIDQSFVKDCTNDYESEALCQAIIAMAHKLGIMVVAEGIETQAQADLLLAAGCDYGQGFLYSKALPAAQFQHLIDKDDTPLDNIA